MLGLVWTQEDLDMFAQHAEESKGNKTLSEMEASPVEQRPSILRYPLSLLVRPELMKSLQEHALPSQGGLYGMPHVPSSAASLSQASKEEFLRKMGATAIDRDDPEYSRADPFGASRRPTGGFAEGPSRPIGGGGKRR